MTPNMLAANAVEDRYLRLISLPLKYGTPHIYANESTPHSHRRCIRIVLHEYVSSKHLTYINATERYIGYQKAYIYTPSESLSLPSLHPLLTLLYSTPQVEKVPSELFKVHVFEEL